MKSIIFFVLSIILYTPNSISQTKAVNGNGQIINKSLKYRDFDKIYFKDLIGEVEVTIGANWSVEIAIDENLLPLLHVEYSADEYQLIIALKNNEDNRLYIEKSNVKINISMPESSVIRQKGNANIKIHNVMGRYFRYEAVGNGNASISGNVDIFDIKKEGNANIDAQQLIAKTAEVKSTGNGNVFVNSQISLSAIGKGNGNIVQYGKGTISPLSGIIGNGEVIKK